MKHLKNRKLLVQIDADKPILSLQYWRVEEK